MDNIGQRLVYIRKNVFALNQIKFAALLRISQGTLSDIENGNRGLPTEAIISLCEHSQEDTPFSLTWLLIGKGEPLSLETQILTEDEREMLNSYTQLDTRGKHIIHAALYKELDRLKANENET